MSLDETTAPPVCLFESPHTDVKLEAEDEASPTVSIRSTDPETAAINLLTT